MGRRWLCSPARRFADGDDDDHQHRGDGNHDGLPKVRYPETEIADVYPF